MAKEEKVKITLDMDKEIVLRLNNEGCIFLFENDTKQEDFYPNIPTELVRKFSPENRSIYHACRGIWREDKDSLDPTEGLSITPNYARPRLRLEVMNKKKGFKYAWKRPDELQIVMAEGGIIDRDPKIKTFGQKDESGRHVVSAGGHVELVLCRWPEKLFKEIYIKAPGDLSEQRSGAAEEAPARSGLQKVSVKNRDGKDWDEIG